MRRIKAIFAWVLKYHLKIIHLLLSHFIQEEHVVGFQDIRQLSSRVHYK